MPFAQRLYALFYEEELFSVYNTLEQAEVRKQQFLKYEDLHPREQKHVWTIVAYQKEKEL